MQRKTLNSASRYEKLFGFCRAQRTGNTVYLAGTAPLGEDGKTVGAGDPAAQARRCMDICADALEQLGSELGHVVRTRMYLTHIEDWEIIGAVHGEYFGDIQPVSTMVEVAGLIDPDWRIEFEAEAIIPD